MNYKTFTELRDYALQRMERSVRRNDPVAARYWADTAEWAGRMSRYPALDLKLQFQAFRLAHETATDYREKQEIYWKLKHLRNLIRANGGSVEALSLDWLREWAAAETRKKVA